MNKEKIGAFVLNNDATYDWTIYVELPAQTGGKRVKVKFTATFRHVSAERRVEILEDYRRRLAERAKAIDSEEDIDRVREVLSFEGLLLQEVLVGFVGIKLPDGSDLAFDDENKAKLISNAWARDALVRAYFQSLKSRGDDAGN